MMKNSVVSRRLSPLLFWMLLIPLAAAVSGCADSQSTVRIARSQVAAVPPPHAIVKYHFPKGERYGGRQASFEFVECKTQIPLDKDGRTLWVHWITRDELAQGWVDLPQCQFCIDGYFDNTLPPLRVTLDNNFLSGGKRMRLETSTDYDLDSKTRRPRWTDSVVHFVYPELQWKKNPAADRWKNHIELTLNSEPQGARVYQAGRFAGVTPFAWRWRLEPEVYTHPKIGFPALVAVADGCLPQQQNLEFDIDPEWQKQEERTFRVATLFLLQRDPNYKPPPQIIVQAPPAGTPATATANVNVPSDMNVTLKQDLSFLDQMLKMGQLMVISKSLRPVGQ